MIFLKRFIYNATLLQTLNRTMAHIRYQSMIELKHGALYISYNNLLFSNESMFYSCAKGHKASSNIYEFFIGGDIDYDIAKK